MFRLALAFILFTGSTASATGPIYIQHFETQDQQFKAELLARNEAISFDEFVQEKLVSPTLHENLKVAFMRAQDQFLKSEISQIESAWQDVANYAYKADWRDTDRAMLEIAFLRLAQLSSEASQTRSWLQTAVSFDSNYQPDSQLYPPPLLQLYESMKKKQNLVEISTELMNGFSQVLINGTEIRIGSAQVLKISDGIKRVTFISSRYQPVTRVVEARSIVDLRPEKKPLVEGDCLSARLSPYADKMLSSETSKIIFSDRCNALATTLPLQSLKPQIKDFSADETIENRIETRHPPKFYEKSSFWISTALATALIVTLQHSLQKDDSDRPTHREGL
jgi:hypothetical protein